MSVNQDAAPVDEHIPSSFWDIGGYKQTVKRVTDGHSLASDMMTLVKERSEIENKYAKELRDWSNKWKRKTNSGPEYGTTEAGWVGVFTEAERVALLHSKVCERLMTEVHSNIRQWQKEHYTKNAIGLGLKQTKEMDEAFHKAQKSWKKKYEKVMAARDEFHKACKNLRTAQITERNQQADTSISQDQKRKNFQKIKEWEVKRDNGRQKYETALTDITEYNARYMEDMTEVYDKCQDMEHVRQEFFRETLFEVHEILNLAENKEYPAIYHDLHATVGRMDSQQDLKHWSNTRGVDMAMNWPTFEEYVPRQAPINKKGMKSMKRGGSDGVTLTMIKSDDNAAPQPYLTQTSVQSESNRNTYNGENTEQHRGSMMQEDKVSVNRPSSYDADLNPFGDGEDLSDIDAEPEASGGDAADNPFEDDYLVDDGRPGVPIRALYDYGGSEDDELTFKAGDEFEKLEDEDEQGWCKGRLNGKVGLYPANYCAEI